MPSSRTQKWGLAAIVLGALCLLVLVVATLRPTGSAPGRTSVAADAAPASGPPPGRSAPDPDAGATGPRDPSAPDGGIAPDSRHDAPLRTVAGADPSSDTGTGAASLDDAPAAVVAERLSEAIERARTERGLPVAEGLVEAVIAHGTVRVIVAQPRARLALEPRLAGTRHSPARYFRHIPYAAIEVGPQALLDLVESLDVLGIEADERNRPSLLDSVPIVSADAATAAGYDGTGLVIAVLDTGVDTTHPVFAGRMVDEACFSRDGDCPGGGTRELGPGTGVPCSFSCGHGTLVAGIALGLDPAGVRTGVAPDAGLVSIQVYSDDDGQPSAWTSDVIAGLEHVYDLRAYYDIAAANLSLGGEDPYDSTDACDSGNPARKAAIDLLRGAGIATIVSSGNDGLTGQLTEPACISSAISVGATTKFDAVPSYSNSADFLSLLAPGSRIETSRSGGGFATSSGTSMAAPHVAGAWAAILEAVPGSNVAEVLFALQSTGAPILDPRNFVTTSRIDVAAAIEALDAGIDIEDPLGTPAPPGFVPPPAIPSSACGLVGLEAVVACAGVRWLAGQRRQRAAPSGAPGA